MRIVQAALLSNGVFHRLHLVMHDIGYRLQRTAAPTATR